MSDYKDITPPLAELKEKNVFPTDGLPDIISRYAKNISEVYGVPIEMTAVPMLVACGSVLKKSVWLDSGKYKNFAQFYLVINTPSGTGKTPALHAAFAPLLKIDSEKYKKYSKEIEEWEAICDANKSKKSVENPPKPKFNQLLSDDFTPEQLIDVLYNNEGSTTIYVDELSGWFANFSRYSKSNEEQTYLSYFNNVDKTKGRVASGIKRITEPFLNIIGGIQPGVLERTINSVSMQENGLSSRFLFVTCLDVQCAYENDLVPDILLVRKYEMLINNLAKLDVSSSFGLTGEAKELYKDFCNYIADNVNSTKSDEFFRSSLSKMKIHCLRFALVLYVIKVMEAKTLPGDVDADAMQYAISLCHYFINNIPVRNKNPLAKMQDTTQKIVDMLKEGKTQTTIAKELGVTQPAVSQTKKRYNL